MNYLDISLNCYLFYIEINDNKINKLNNYVFKDEIRNKEKKIIYYNE